MQHLAVIFTSLCRFIALVQCIATGCVKCDSLRVCTQCEAGKYLNDLKSCSDCGTVSSSQTYCTECLGANICIKCNNKYGLLSGLCNKCTDYGIGSNCKSCNFTDSLLNGAVKCLACELGYDHGKDCDTRYPCPRNCEKCNLGQCLECRIGFGLKSTINTVDQCLRIYFVLFSSISLACTNNCLYCSNGLCSRCVDGYYP